jgi:hypothetical protein
VRVKGSSAVAAGFVLLSGWLPATLRADERKPEIPKRGDTPPSTQEPAGPGPAALIAKWRGVAAPKLGGRRPDAAYKAAVAYVDWAAMSGLDQADEVRRTLAALKGDAPTARAFCDEAMKSREVDVGRALVALSLLGELRSPAGEACLGKLLQEKLPERGTVVDGEVQEAVALSLLQAKAVAGLAYLGTATANKLVLNAAARHPSRTVRAEAIAALLWNSKESAEARQQLERVVLPEEKIFLDRPVRRAGEQGAEFNRRLEAFLKAHPELKPPAPEPRKPEEDVQTPEPPKP